MPSWHELMQEVHAAGSIHDVTRRKYLRKLQRLTKRNTVAYYSGWLQKQGRGLPTAVNDADKNGLMTVVHKLDRSKGLDLLLHTEGGEVAATESIVDYLYQMFDGDIRAVIPQLAMSAGTMISCSCRKVLMGKQSSLGPIDPQLGGLAAHGVVEEFERACEEVAKDPRLVPVWQPIIAKYRPTLIGECQKAIDWSTEIVKEWLVRNMLSGREDAETLAAGIVKELGDHALTKSHSRHLSLAKCQSIGLEVAPLEDDQDLQDAVLSVHHAYILTLSRTAAFKIIESHRGVAYILVASPGPSGGVRAEHPAPEHEEEPLR